MMKPLLLVFATGLCGCVVTQGTYDKLRAQQEETQSQLEARNKVIADYEKSTAALKATQARLETALADAKARASELDARIGRSESDRAALVKDRSKLEASVSEMTAALAELQKRKEAADARLAEFRALLTKFKGLIDAGKLKVKIVEGRMVVVLNTDVLFPSGSASLSRDGKTAIGEVAGLLASIPDRKFQIEGHTDNVPISTAQYPSNWELAAGRALTVLKTMVESGMPTTRISAASFGDSKPSGANDSPEGRAGNRRIEIIIVPDLSTLPGFDELNRVEKGA